MEDGLDEAHPVEGGEIDIHVVKIRIDEAREEVWIGEEVLRMVYRGRDGLPLGRRGVKGASEKKQRFTHWLNDGEMRTHGLRLRPAHWLAIVVGLDILDNVE